MASRLYPQPPGAPRYLNSTDRTHNSATLRWNAPNTGGPVARYHVYRVVGSTNNRIATTTNTAWPLSGLTPNTSYSYFVVAEGSGFLSARSNTHTFTTLPSNGNDDYDGKRNEKLDKLKNPDTVPARGIPAWANVNTTLNVRAGPGIGYTRLAELDRHEAVYAIARAGDWIRIGVNPRLYVHMDFITFTRPTVTNVNPSGDFRKVACTMDGFERDELFTWPIPSGFTRRTSLNITNTVALTHLQNSTIFAFRGHGGQSAIATRYEPPNSSLMTRQMVSNLPNNALNDVSLVVYGACRNGEGGLSAQNLVNGTYNQGAQIVIGWQVVIGRISTNAWTDEFMTYLANRNSVWFSMQRADQLILEENRDENLLNRLERGNANVRFERR